MATEKHGELYRLAEATPVRAWAGTIQIPDAVRIILQSLDPLPAVLINGAFDIIASNDAHEELFWDWHSLPCVHKNLLWCCLTEPTAREQFPDYDREIPHLVARYRAAYGQHVGDPGWEEDIRRLAELSPEFARLWARQEVAGPAARVRQFRHRDAGLLTFTATELDVAEVPGLRIAIDTPRDGETWARLPAARRHGQEARASS